MGLCRPRSDQSMPVVQLPFAGRAFSPFRGAGMHPRRHGAIEPIGEKAMEIIRLFKVRGNSYTRTQPPQSPRLGSTHCF